MNYLAPRLSGYNHSTTNGGLVAKSCLTCATPWTVACQAPLSLRFSRQEYWRGLSFPSPGDLQEHRNRTRGSCIAGRFFTNWARRDILRFWEMETIPQDSRLKYSWVLESQASKSNNETVTFKTTKHLLQDSIPFVLVRFCIWSTV